LELLTNGAGLARKTPRVLFKGANKMATHKHWNVSGGQLMDAVRREVDELVGRLQDSEWSEELSSFAPRTNLAETATHFEISMDLPEMKSQDFLIEMHEGRLTVSGERKREEKVEGKTFHRVERHFGKFRRTFNLGSDVEPDKITAEYKLGVLRLRVPKSEKAQPKRIEVKVTGD
jgi:HSP20 family protein